MFYGYRYTQTQRIIHGEQTNTHTFSSAFGAEFGGQIRAESWFPTLVPLPFRTRCGAKNRTIFASKNDFILEALLRAGLGGLQQSLSRCGPGLAGGSASEASVGCAVSGCEKWHRIWYNFWALFLRFLKKI